MHAVKVARVRDWGYVDCWGMVGVLSETEENAHRLKGLVFTG